MMMTNDESIFLMVPYLRMDFFVIVACMVIL